MNPGAGRCWRFSKFSLVGIIGAALQLTMVSLLTHYLRVCTVAAAAVAVEIAIIHNFAWHERFTWPDRGKAKIYGKAVRFGKFQATNGLLSLIGNVALAYWLAQRLQIPLVFSTGLAIAACSLANFLLADRLIYE